MNSDKIKKWLIGKQVNRVDDGAAYALNYILALEAERDAWRQADEAFGDPPPEFVQRAMTRVDSFNPPAAPGEGEKA